ncbi:hypothetical protein GCM10023211_23930 [Orbus sasakiae]|uniref:Uncharacterized protein n=1 Tax=Orbus sasakiae TaxID=1078475 RepID=A0ABP9NE37_9GAMM
MKRLIILCLCLISFMIEARETIEQQEQWSIVKQDNWSKPRYILTVKHHDFEFSLLCAQDIQQLIFILDIFNTQQLDSYDLSTDLHIKLFKEKTENIIFGTMFKNGKDSVSWTNNIYYSGFLKGYNKEKAKLLPILSQLFKQFLTASGDITFTTQGEGDTVYQATINSDGLPTIFNHFAQYCGPDFIEAFDLAMDEK